MTPLQKLKNDLLDSRRRAGMRDSVNVDACALNELLDDYERLYSADRVSNKASRENVNLHLHDAIQASYHQNGKDSERTLAVIMETLLKLIDEKLKQKSTVPRFHKF